NARGGGGQGARAHGGARIPQLPGGARLLSFARVPGCGGPAPRQGRGRSSHHRRLRRPAVVAGAANEGGDTGDGGGMTMHRSRTARCVGVLAATLGAGLVLAMVAASAASGQSLSRVAQIAPTG